MERFGSILAVLRDGATPAGLHDLAFDLAIDLAVAHRAALNFVDVIAPEGAAAADVGIAGRRARLAEAVAAAEARGLTTTEAVVRGDPAVEVIRMVLREGHDLVLIAAGGPDDTAARLLADCPSPVWVVGAGRPDAVLAILPAQAAAGDLARLEAAARTVAAHLGLAVARISPGDVPAMSVGTALAVTTGRAADLAGARSVFLVKPEGFVSPVTLETAPQLKTARRANGSAGKG